MRGWRWIGRWLFMLLFCCFVWNAGYSHVSAAGANVSIKTDANPVVKGEIFYVMITVTSTEEMGGFEGYFSYNQGVMKYMTGGSVSSGNDDVFSVSDMERERSATTLKYSIQFKARRSGVSTVELKSPYNAYNADRSEKMSVAYDSLNIRVLSKKEARRQQENALGQTEKPTEEAGGDGSSSGEEKPAEETTGENSNGEEFSAKTGQDGKLPDSTMKESAGEEEPADVLEKDIWTASPQPAVLAAEDGDTSSGGGLSRRVCIAVIIIAGINLILLGLAFVRIKRQSIWEEEQEPEEESESDVMWETMDGTDSLENWDDSDDMEKSDEWMDVNGSEASDSLEQIERRLEQKRRWLRKDEN